MGEPIVLGDITLLSKHMPNRFERSFLRVPLFCACTCELGLAPQRVSDLTLKVRLFPEGWLKFVYQLFAKRFGITTVDASCNCRPLNPFPDR
jgi:hypothetical protein